MKHLATVGPVAALLCGWLPQVNTVRAGAQDREPAVWLTVDRVVAVGDVHGDYEQLVAVLRSANIIDGEGNWTGGKAHLVQTA